MARTMDGEFVDREDRIRKIRRIHGIARLMDTAVQIPGTKIRFGADSVIGLVPSIGDAGGALIGLFIVNDARRLGLPKPASFGGRRQWDVSRYPRYGRGRFHRVYRGGRGRFSVGQEVMAALRRGVRTEVPRRSTSWCRRRPSFRFRRASP
jgi:hypothetical protein